MTDSINHSADVNLQFFWVHGGDVFLAGAGAPLELASPEVRMEAAVRRSSASLTPFPPAPLATLEKIDAWFDANAFENVDASAVKAKVAELRGAR